MATNYYDISSLAEGTRVSAVLRLERRPRGKQIHTFAIFRCACGREAGAWASALRNGVTKSCGCLHSEVAARTSTKHGRYKGAQRRHPLCATWIGMQVRCYHSSAAEYPYYGGRGIRVCRRWSGANGFENFVSDMGPRPKGHTLDRVDNAKGYSPKNCRWATPTQQRNNVRRNRLVEVNCVSRTLGEWSAVTGIGRTTISARLDKGWSAEMAVGTPVRGKESAHGN